MHVKLLRQFIVETLQDRDFIRHLENGIGYARGDQTAEAYQIASDWLEDVELRTGSLLHPGHVSRIERFVAREWPTVRERFRGRESMALIAMNNLLDAKFNELEVG